MQGQYCRLLYHAVWATRMREPLLDGDLRPKLHKYLHDKVFEYGGAALAAGGTADHVHLVFSIPPHAALAPFIGRLKGSSSHWVNHFYHPGGDFAWQGGYGALTIAESDLDRICGYVRDQERRHQQETTVAAYEDLTHRSRELKG